MSEVITLLIAWRLAIEYKEDQSKAIYLCAREVWTRIENVEVKHLVAQLADRKTSDTKRIATVQELERRLRKENMI